VSLSIEERGRIKRGRIKRGRIKRHRPEGLNTLGFL
jgi:hypothetical protein